MQAQEVVRDSSLELKQVVRPLKVVCRSNTFLENLIANVCFENLISDFHVLFGRLLMKIFSFLFKK